MLIEGKPKRHLWKWCQVVRRLPWSEALDVLADARQKDVRQPSSANQEESNVLGLTCY